MSKAKRTLATAVSLLSNDDAEGACNRAYYAMFYAAHVALMGASDAPDISYNSHRAVISAFGRHVVIGTQMDPDLGRSINEVQRLRMLVDYIGDPFPLADATRAVALAQEFVGAIRAKFLPGPPA